MSCENAPHVGDVGFRFYVTVVENGLPFDLSGATSVSLKFQRTDLTAFTVTPTLVGGGTGGQCYYATVAGNLNQAGQYKVQPVVVIGASTYYCETLTFAVLPSL